MIQLKMLFLAIWTFFVPNILQKHITAQSAVQAYRIVSNSNGRGETTITDVQMKNGKFYIRTPQFIAVDNTMYYQDTDGTWKNRVMDIATTEKFNLFRPTWVAKNLQDTFAKSKFTKIGMEKCGDLTCFKYEEIDPKDPQAKRTFWFDNRQYLLRRDIFTFAEFSSENNYSYDDINIQIPN